MEWFSKNKYWIAAGCLFALSVILRWFAASQSPHPTGWDGYYYVMQVHSWMTYGYLQSPDFSLIYPFFTAIAFVTSDFILAYQVGVALLSGLLVVAVFYSLHKRHVAFGWICIVCSYLLFSPLLTYFALQFPKNVLGLIFLVLFIASIPNRLPALIFLFATVITHRMTGGFALIIVTIYAVKNISLKWIIAGSVVLLLLSLLPGILHVSDLARFKDQFGLMPHWAPYSFYKIFPNASTVWFKIDLVIVTGVALIAMYLNVRKPDIYWIIIGIICIFPFFEFDAGSAGHRFFMLAPIAFIMAIPFEKFKFRYSAIPIGAFSIAAIFSIKSYSPAFFDPPNGTYRRIIAKLVANYDPKNYPLVIVHKSLAEMIIFTTDFDALNWLPPKDMPATHVLRLINGVYYPYFRKYLDEPDYKQVRAVSRDYFVAPEDVWQRFVTNAGKDSNTKVMADIFNGRNPMDERPYFLNKGKLR